MKATRRKFFGWMATTPLAAKAAGDQAIADLSHIDIKYPGISIPDVYGFPGEAQVNAGNILTWEEKLKRSVAYVKMFGLPPEIKENLRKQSKRIHTIDYDIANKKSWSMAFKITCQRQRNYEKCLAALEENNNKFNAMKKTRDALGFEFPEISI